MNDNELLKLINNEYYRIIPKGCKDFMMRRDKRIPCLPKLQERFGKTYNGILLLAGIKDEELNFVRRDKEQYLEKIKKVKSQLGYTPNYRELIAAGCSGNVIKDLFGSVKNALKEIDDNYEYRGLQTHVKETNEELLKMYINFSNKLGYPASIADLNNSSEIYNSGVFIIRFGGMPELKKEAGYKPYISGNRRWSKEKVAISLINKRLEKGSKLIIKDVINCDDLPCTATIMKNFKTTKIKEIFEGIDLIIKKIEGEKIKIIHDWCN